MYTGKIRLLDYQRKCWLKETGTKGKGTNGVLKKERP